MKSPIIALTAEEICNFLKNPAAELNVIAIDGIDGTGKSFLAKHLNHLLNFPHIEGDSFLRNGYGYLPYPNCLDLDSLRCAVDDARVLNSTVIVESVMVRLVLDAIGIDQAFHIYVQRRSPDGALQHSEMFDDQLTESDLIATSVEVGRLVGIAEQDDSLFDRQLIRYHKRRSPHRHASVLYEVCF